MQRAPVYIALLTLTGTSLFADVVTYTTTSGAGQFGYAFTVTNTGGTGGTLFDLFLSVPTDITNIDTASIGSPVGWGDPTGGLLFFGADTNPGTSFLEWSADFSGVYDVGIGGSLSGFSVLSSQIIDSPIMFGLNGSIELSTAQGVSGVQEPAPFIMLLSTLIVLRRVRPIL